MNKMKKMMCAFLAMVMVVGVCVIPTRAAEGSTEPRQIIQAKFDAAEEGGRVQLSEDYTWWDGEPVVISKDVRLELVNCTIESLENFPVFEIKSGAELTIDWFGTIKNAELPENWEELYDEATRAQLGLFEVEEGAKLILNRGTYEAGYKMFTDNSAGEIIINGGSYNMIPEGNYTIPDWKCMAESGWDDGYYCLASAIKVGIPVDEIEMPSVEQDFEIEVRVTNQADYAIENVEVQAGYEDCFHADRPYYTFDKAVAGEKYTVSGAQAIIPRIEAGETIWVTFSTVIPKEMTGKRISFESQANIIVNGESVDEQTGGTGWFCAYDMIVDTRDSISETQVSKSVANITAVKKQATETAVKEEVLQLVQDFWLYEEMDEERIESEEMDKVSEGFFSGQVIKSELVLKEMTADEIQQIAASDKTMLEDKARSELGTKASLRYLDLSLLIQDESKELGTIDKLQEEMAITIAIPDEMKADGGVYKILRCHNGEVAVLDTVVNKDGTLTFKTDHFSTYALAYVGKVNVIEDEKTETTISKEMQTVVENIEEAVADSVVDEKTAEKVGEAINNGEDVTAEIVVVKVPQDEIAQIEQNAIEDKVTSELGAGAKVQYLDVSIVLKAGDEELGTLNKLEEEITITVAIPEELKVEGRTYKVIRNHNGVVDVLDTVVNEDGTISFKTDRFSTYALAYADEEETGTNLNPGNKPSIDSNKPSADDNKDTSTNTNTNTNQGNKPATDTKAPQTGDNNSVLIYVAICLVALAAILVTKKRNAFVK